MTPSRSLRALMLAVTLAVVALARCGPFRNGVATVTPTVPGNGACLDGAKRCNGLVPESCRRYDDVPRWYPLATLGMDGGPAGCASACVVDGDPPVAHCAGARDGGAP